MTEHGPKQATATGPAVLTPPAARMPDIAVTVARMAALPMSPVLSPVVHALQHHHRSHSSAVAAILSSVERTHRNHPIPTAAQQPRTRTARRGITSPFRTCSGLESTQGTLTVRRETPAAEKALRRRHRHRRHRRHQARRRRVPMTPVGQRPVTQLGPAIPTPLGKATLAIVPT